MAEEADNLVVRILREIQSVQAEHSRVLQEHSKEFRRVHDEIADLREVCITSGGLSMQANVTNKRLESAIEAILDRLSRVEDKLELTP